MNEFKKYLFNRYGGFGDKRVKDINKDYPFKIDDQTDGDNHDRFCGIFVRVIDDANFELDLTNNAPTSPKIKELVESKRGEVQAESDYGSINVTLTLDDHIFIERLSNEIDRLIAPGRKYTDPNWKWLCPRTAESLRQFAGVLKSYQGKERKRKRFLGTST